MLRGHPEQKQSFPRRRKEKAQTAPVPSATVEEIDEATEILLSARESYLMGKRYTTLDDDLELKLLKDPTARLHATRIAELAFKEDKTDMEKYELELYENEETRPYAYRIVELQSKENPTFLEKNELGWLLNPYYRPYVKEYLRILHKEDLTPQEDRTLELFRNPTTLKNAIKIATLESLDTLAEDQMQELSIAYLSKIAEVPLSSENDFHVNFRSRAFNPVADCVVRDATTKTYDVEVAKFRAIQDAFDQAAGKLIESYQRQVFRKAEIESIFRGHSLYQQNNPKISSIFEKRKNALSLTLQKIFFDHNLPFSQNNLNTITDYLNQLVQNKQLSFTTDDFKSLQQLLNSQSVSLTEQSIATTPSSLRP